jgi:hypothetical protein
LPATRLLAWAMPCGANTHGPRAKAPPTRSTAHADERSVADTVHAAAVVTLPQPVCGTNLNVLHAGVLRR